MPQTAGSSMFSQVRRQSENIATHYNARPLKLLAWTQQNM